jgi:hypothetical protein
MFMAVSNMSVVVSNVLVLYYCNSITIRYQKKIEELSQLNISTHSAVNIFVDFSIHQYKTRGLDIK